MKKRIGKLFLIFTALFLTSCGNMKEEENPPLTICVDFQYESAVSELVDTWKELNHDFDAKLIIIPKDADAAEIKISELRTEIMSGGGPDVFILEGMLPTTEEAGKVLFSDPEKMMYSEVFLPLDQYMENAQYMNPDAWNPIILSSGRTEEGQLILPICYEYYAYVFRTSDLASSENIPSSWEELITCEEKPIIKETCSKVFVPFYNIFAKLADYQKEILLYSEEEFLTQTQEAILLREKYFNMENSDTIPNAVVAGKIEPNFFSILEREREDHTIFALPNTDGGITASVTIYAAINHNTKQAEQAFSLLDVLFSDEIMCGDGFQIGGKTKGNNVISLITYGSIGIPIHQKALQQLCERITKKDAEALIALDHQIQTVCYASDFNREIADMYRNCTRVREESEREEIISQVYHTLQMNLSE